MGKRTLLESKLNLFHVDFFRHGPCMGVNKTNSVVNLKIISKFRGQLKLENVINLVNLITAFNIKIIRDIKSVPAHDFMKDVPGNTIVLTVCISVSKNKCFQYLLSFKNAMCRFSAASRFNSLLLR